MKMVHVITSVSVVFFLSLFTFVFVVRNHSANVREQIYVQDFSTILHACRELIDNRAMLADDWDHDRVVHKHAIVLTRKRRPYDVKIPKPIRDLNPYYIAVHNDHVFINMGTAPRNGILGFSTNATQYGTVQLVDGLWFWN